MPGIHSAWSVKKQKSLCPDLVALVITNSGVHLLPSCERNRKEDKRGKITRSVFSFILYYSLFAVVTLN